MTSILHVWNAYRVKPGTEWDELNKNDRQNDGNKVKDKAN
jgi:hypothetical protein